MQSESSSETDINDVFSNIFMSEEGIIEESYKEGYQQGKAEGNVEGFHLGYHRGAEIGAELGYYYEIINHYLQELRSTNKNHPDVREKVLNISDNVIEMINSFPRCNSEDVDILKALEDIRTKFKKICAILQVNLQYDTFESNKLSF